MFTPRLEANAISNPNTGNSSLKPVTTNTSPDPGHIIFIVVGLIGLVISTSCLALRTSTTRQLSTSHILVLAVFLLGCFFGASTLFLYFGLGIYKDKACRSAMALCLIFYLGQKYGLYLFLVERTHITQANSKSRTKDPIYLAGLAFVLVGFTAIGISAFATFKYSYATTCTIGLLRPVAITVLSWDIFVNMFLTVVFLYHIRDFLVDGLIIAITPPFLRRLTKCFRREDSSRVTIAQDNLVHVIRKTFWGSVGILLSTVANFGILLSYAGNEPVWLCFTLCTFDVNWAVIIIFWLTEPTHTARSGARSKAADSRFHQTARES